MKSYVTSKQHVMIRLHKKKLNKSFYLVVQEAQAILVILSHPFFPALRRPAPVLQSCVPAQGEALNRKIVSKDHLNYLSVYLLNKR